MTKQVIFEQSMQQGFRFLPKPYPTVYDRGDQMSDFAYALILGYRKLIEGLSDVEKISWLIRNSLLYVRAKRFKAVRKHLVIRCVCGKKVLKYGMNSFSNIKPCHGTAEEMTFKPFVCYGDEVVAIETRSFVRSTLGRTSNWIEGLNMDALPWT